MGAFTADPERILGLVERARNIDARTEQRLADIERLLESLHVTWEGSAAKAHRDAHETWIREAEDMNTMLTRLEALARAAKDRYRGAVAHNVGMWP